MPVANDTDWTARCAGSLVPRPAQPDLTEQQAWDRINRPCRPIRGATLPELEDNMAIVMTGFPGFLGSALLPRILSRTGESAICVIQARYAALATSRVAGLVAADASLTGRITLVNGDVSRPGLGVDDPGALAAQTTEVWHLAAVYDVAAARDLALRVNVEGTRNVLDFAAGCPKLRRLHYFSTCYVSGRYAGAFGEDDLTKGQHFNNVYDETKYLAELEVRRRMANGLPATVYRPGSVVGDSRTGETQKYDGPYFVLQLLLRQPAVAVLPVPANLAISRFNIVPRDFIIEATSYLAGLPGSEGRTYQLADPDPLTNSDIMTVMARATGRRVVRVRVNRRLAKASIARVPGVQRLLRIPPEIVDYFDHPTHYLSDHTRADLAGSGIQVPPFAAYVDRLVTYMRQHPEFSSSAMT